MKQPPGSAAAVHMQQQMQQQQLHSSADRKNEGTFVASSANGSSTVGNLHLGHTSTIVLSSAMSLSMKNTTHVAPNSRVMGFDKDTTASSFAAVATLQNLSTSAPQQSLSQLHSNNIDGTTVDPQPVQLFPDNAEDDEEDGAETAGRNQHLSNNGESLHTDIPRQSGASSGSLSHFGGKSSVPTSALGSVLLTSYQRAHNSGPIGNLKNNRHPNRNSYSNSNGTLNTPQSPLRTLSQNSNNYYNGSMNGNLNYSLSAVDSPPKLLELAEWCEER